MGGAGSLEVVPGLLLNTAPQFPKVARAESDASVVYLAALRAGRGAELDLSLAFRAVFAGGRTGTFRFGKDQLLVTPNGRSISFEDYAIALVDEIETPRHAGTRFTIGY